MFNQSNCYASFNSLKNCPNYSKFFSRRWVEPNGDALSSARCYVWLVILAGDNPCELAVQPKWRNEKIRYVCKNSYRYYCLGTQWRRNVRCDGFWIMHDRNPPRPSPTFPTPWIFGETTRTENQRWVSGMMAV